jgi:hypothetical protein
VEESIYRRCFCGANERSFDPPHAKLACRFFDRRSEALYSDSDLFLHEHGVAHDETRGTTHSIMHAGARKVE